MTRAKEYHRQARALLILHLDMHPGRTVDADLDPAEVGIVGDTPHVLGGDSYHLGADQIRARNGRNRYSVDESPRDKRGLDDHASGMDVGWFKVTTRRGTFTLRDYSVWLVNLCKTGDPDTLDLREVIYSPDGKTVKRWDREGRRSSGDKTHLGHTHKSEYRDATGIRMLRLARRWLQHIGLIEEDGVSQADVIAALKSSEGRAAIAKAAITQSDFDVRMDAWWTSRMDHTVSTPSEALRQLRVAPWHQGTGAGGAGPTVFTVLFGTMRAELAALAGVDPDDVDEAAIVAGVLAGLDPAAIAAAIPADLAQRVADELATRLQG